MKQVKDAYLTEERALFGEQGLDIRDTVFDVGESPLKECSDIAISNCLFRYKYPLWYTKNVTVKDSVWFQMARAGVWYVDNMDVSDSVVQAPKNFRRVKGLRLRDVTFTNAQETLWSCSDVKLERVTAKGDYFAMNCADIEVDGLTLDGNYSFDGVKNLKIKNSTLVSKDAFWNCENVTVEDSFITGEYLGWNSRNVTLINCTIESLQGMCYIEDLVMKNCHLINTTLAFEYASVDAEIDSRIESVLNPTSGTIKAKEIGTLILTKNAKSPGAHIVCDAVEERTDVIDWTQQQREG